MPEHDLPPCPHIPPPPEKGSPVGTADMHGGGVTFRDREGNLADFEIVRKGTTKEFETAKGALATSRAAEQSLDGINSELKTKIGAQAERIEAAETAYKTIKVETQALLTNADKNCMELREKLEAASNAYSTEKEVSAELTKANQGLAEGIQRQKDTIADLTQALAAEKQGGEQLKVELTTARSELENLMTVKASLEETNTALEVSQKDLCESKEDAAALKVEIHGLDDQICEATGSVLGDRNEMLAEVVTERNTSRQALANIKAELLTEGDRFKTILDTMAEKISGE